MQRIIVQNTEQTKSYRKQEENEIVQLKVKLADREKEI